MTHQLEVTTRGDRELVITRAFDAPRSLVYDCFTKPELIRRWLWGPDGWSFKECTVDFRVGGKYRYVWQNQSGEIMGMGGTYTAIQPMQRIENTELFDEDWTGGETLNTLIFEDHQGGTLTTTIVRYNSKEIRDQVLESGMTDGMETSYRRLEKQVLEPARSS